MLIVTTVSAQRVFNLNAETRIELYTVQNSGVPYIVHLVSEVEDLTPFDIKILKSWHKYNKVQKENFIGVWINSGMRIESIHSEHIIYNKKQPFYERPN